MDGPVPAAIPQSVHLKWTHSWPTMNWPMNSYHDCHKKSNMKKIQNWNLHAWKQIPNTSNVHFVNVKNAIRDGRTRHRRTSIIIVKKNQTWKNVKIEMYMLESKFKTPQIYTFLLFCIYSLFIFWKCVTWQKNPPQKNPPRKNHRRHHLNAWKTIWTKTLGTENQTEIVFVKWNWWVVK